MSTATSTPEFEVRSIGEIIKDTRNLGTEQVERILAYQRSHGVRFGEAAVALGLASSDDVLLALSQQFHYPYANEESRRLNPELVALNQPFGREAEAFRAIRSQILQCSQVDGQAQVLMRRAIAVVSPGVGEGKTYFSANLAITLAQLGGRTLVIDADMRGPRQHEVFRVDNHHGLSRLLARRPLENGAQVQAIKKVAGVPNLFVLPVGAKPPNPLELIEGPAFGALLMEIVSKFDHVIVDTPAATCGVDAAVLGARCGLALVIARRNLGRVAALQDLVQTLTNANAKIAGVVLNEY